MLSPRRTTPLPTFGVLVPQPLTFCMKTTLKSSIELDVGDSPPFLEFTKYPSLTLIRLLIVILESFQSKGDTINQGTVVYFSTRVLTIPRKVEKDTRTLHTNP